MSPTKRNCGNGTTAMLTTFLYSLAGGMLCVLPTGRTDRIAWRFMRLVGAIVLAVVCLATVWCIREGGSASPGAGRWIVRLGIASATATAVVVLIAPLATRVTRLFNISCVLGGLLSVTAACVLAVAKLGEHGGLPVGLTTAVVISQVLGALLLGSVTVAWLLGHAYLTATRMTIAPLRHFSRLLSWAVAVRITFLVISLAVAWLARTDDGSSVLSQIVSQAWLVLILRAGVGLVAVGVFAYMVSDCVRLRSTQSATGILYFGSLCAYTGELASRHLSAQYGWPL